MADRVFVIVGASLAGATAAQGLREGGFDGRVVLIGEEPALPYARPELSEGTCWAASRWLTCWSTRPASTPSTTSHLADPTVDLADLVPGAST